MALREPLPRVRQGKSDGTFHLACHGPRWINWLWCLQFMLGTGGHGENRASRLCYLG